MEIHITCGDSPEAIAREIKAHLRNPMKVIDLNSIARVIATSSEGRILRFGPPDIIWTRSLNDHEVNIRIDL